MLKIIIDKILNSDDVHGYFSSTNWGSSLVQTLLTFLCGEVWYKHYFLICIFLYEFWWVYFYGKCSLNPWSIWIVKYARFVEIPLGLLLQVMFLSLAMSVLSRFAGPVMNMSEKMAISLVLSARLATKDTKVSLLFFSSFWFCHLINQKISITFC